MDAVLEVAYGADKDTKHMGQLLRNLDLLSLPHHPKKQNSLKIALRQSVSLSRA